MSPGGTPALTPHRVSAPSKPMMDRNKAAELPKLQVGFIDFVCTFVYKVRGGAVLAWVAGGGGGWWVTRSSRVPRAPPSSHLHLTSSASPQGETLPPPPHPVSSSEALRPPRGLPPSRCPGPHLEVSPQMSLPQTPPGICTLFSGPRLQCVCVCVCSGL